MLAVHEATPSSSHAPITVRDIDWACRHLARFHHGFRTNAEVLAVMRRSTNPTDQEAVRILDARDASREERARLAAAGAAGDACGSLPFIRPLGVIESEGKRFNFDGLGGCPVSTSTASPPQRSAHTRQVRHRYGNGVSGRYQRRGEDGQIITGSRAVLILRQSLAKFTAKSTYRWEHTWLACVGNVQLPGTFSTFRLAEQAVDAALEALGAEVPAR